MNSRNFKNLPHTSVTTYQIGVWCCLLWFTVSLASCSTTDEGESQAIPLAKVYNKTLYLSDLEGLIPVGSTSEDSTYVINSYIDRWVREMVIMAEAEQNVPKDLNIDKLVRDYRSSLVKHNYEQILIEQFLDSTVTNKELQDFCTKYSDQFLLNEPVFRAHFVKLPAAAPELKEFEKWWNNYQKPGNMPALTEYAATYATNTRLDDSTWYEASDFYSEMPANWLTPSNLANKKEIVQKDGNFIYYFRILQLVPANSEPPFSWVSGKARRLILHQRKQKVLEQKREEMYERELRQNNIKTWRR